MEISEIIGYSTLGLFAVIALIGFIRGLFKGTFRSLSDIVFVLLNAVLSVFLAKATANALLNVGSILDLLYELEETFNSEWYSSFLQELTPYVEEGSVLRSWDWGYILALPAIIITPVLFLVFFFVFGILFKLVKFIVQKIFIPKTKGAGLRLLGGLLGAVRCVLALAIFLVPIIGFANYAYTLEPEIAKISNQEILDEEIKGYADTALCKGTLKITYDYGGKWLFETLTTTQVHNIKVSLTDETYKALEIYSHIPNLMSLGENGVEGITEEQILEIEDTIRSLEKSEYFTALIASVMAQASSELYHNGGIYEFKLPSFGKVLDPVVDKLLEVWTTTDGNALTQDLETYVSIFDNLIEKQLFAKIGTDELMPLLEDKEFYNGILTPLHSNPRTKPVVPTVADALQTYLYQVYEKVNGEPYGNGEIIKVNTDKINNADMDKESEKIATAIMEIRKFVDSIAEEDDLEDIVKVGDFAALGRGLNNIEDSLFFSNSYHFMLETLLGSQTCADLGIFDSMFIENATKPDADMEKLLLSRQHITILTMAMWDDDKKAQEESLKVLIEEMVVDDTNALKELTTVENLAKYGIDGEKATTISNMVSSLVDTIHTHEFETEEEKHKEAESTAHVLTTLNSAHTNVEGATNVFENSLGEPSKTGETASNVIEHMLDSQIVMEMVASASSSGVIDPYNVQNYMSDSDIASLESVLAEKLEQSVSANEQKSINDLAFIFGIDFSENN